MEKSAHALPTQRGLRAHIALCGPCNGGKSSLLNALVQSDTALVSAQAGTTTDPVYKNMELLPYGPVTFIDTPGLDDASDLGEQRIRRSRRALQEADLVCLVSRPDQMAETARLWQELRVAGSPAPEVPVLLAISHGPGVDDIDQTLASQILGTPARLDLNLFLLDSPGGTGLDTLQKGLCKALETHRRQERKLLEDLVRPCKLVLMVVPIDLEAPAGRLILPQVQAIREVLDADAATLVVKEREIEWALSLLKRPPDLAICDSQVVLKAAASIPEAIPLTTFSILFSRQKGDLEYFIRSARTMDSLQDGDRILIAETCTHRSSCDDIGRVKIPRWLRQYTGRDLDIQTHTGPLPDDLGDYKLVIHCGGCMITRRMMLSRMAQAEGHQVPVTNYGLAISRLQGVLDRVVAPLGF